MSQRVYAVAGGKGGVGKTSVTANLGVALQDQGYDVAAVDADLGMTNLGSVLGVRASQGVHHVLAGETTVEAVLTDGPGGIGVVPGAEGLHQAGDADPSNLKRVIEPLSESHDIVLIDTGAGVSHQNLVALGLADATIAVSTPSGLAATDAGKTVEMVDRVDSAVAGLVLTRIDGESDRKVAAEIARDLEQDVLALVPSYEKPDPPEPRYGEAPGSPAAQEYERLATALSVYHQTGDSAAAADRAANDRPAPGEGTATDGDDSDNADGLLSRFSSFR